MTTYVFHSFRLQLSSINHNTILFNFVCMFAICSIVVFQVFVFVTISKFGALNCALIGLGRKMLSLLLSFVLYGHTLNAIQTVGLTLSLVAMIANFYEKVSYSHLTMSICTYRNNGSLIVMPFTFLPSFLNNPNLTYPNLMLIPLTWY